MQPDELQAAVDRYAAAKNQHNVDAVLDLCAEDSVYEAPALGLRVRGRDDLRRYYERLFRAGIHHPLTNVSS